MTRQPTVQVAARQTPDAALLARFRRIEGQARGLRRMYEEGRPTQELVDQVAALRGALSGLGLELLAGELTQTIHAPMISPTGSPTGVTDPAERLCALIRRLVRSS